MKNIISLSIILLILTAAATAAPWSKQEKYQPEKGDQALQFQINAGARSSFSSGYLSEYSGSMLSYKKMISDHKALQIGLGLTGLLYSVEESQDFYHMDSLNVDGSEDDSYLSLDLSIMLVNSLSGNRAWFYYGYGPSISYSQSYDEYETDLNSEPPEFYMQERSTSLFEAGLTAVAGVEWGLNSFLTLHAEYRSSFSYRLQTSDQNYSSEDHAGDHERTSKINQFRFSSDGVRFGLSVYF